MSLSTTQHEELAPIPSLEEEKVSLSDLLLYALEAFSEKIQGKTLLQKRIYFVGVLTHSLPQLGYRAHFYGPYSGAVEATLSRLCHLEFVKKTEDDVPVSGSGLEVKRFTFALTSDGKAVATLDHDDQTGLLLKQSVQAACRAIQEAGDLDATALSIAAKTHFLLERKGGSGWTDEVAGLAQDFNWSITPVQVNAAADFLMKLKLIKISNSQTV